MLSIFQENSMKYKLVPGAQSIHHFKVGPKCQVCCPKRKCLKVVGNEKLGGFKFLQLLGINLGPWRSMSIFILNVPFAIEKPISVSALSSKMNRRFDCN